MKDILEKFRTIIYAPPKDDEDLKSNVVMVRKLCLLMIPYCIILSVIMVMYTNSLNWLIYLAGSFYAGYIIYISHRQSIQPCFIRTVALFLAFSLLSLFSGGWNLGFQFPFFIAVLMVLLNPGYDTATKYICCIFFVLILNGVNMFFRTDTSIYEPHVLLINELFMLFFTCAIGLTVATTSQKTEHELFINNRKLHNLAETDPLTGLPNRRSMEKLMDKISTDSQTYPEFTTIAIGDIDHFKSFNDTYGHECGDYVLTELSRMMAEIPYARCGRWGGEEFLILFLGVNGDDAFMALNSFLAQLSNHIFEYNGNELSITMTFGVSEYDSSCSFKKIIEEADKKLYMGKKKGRKQVVF